MSSSTPNGVPAEKARKLVTSSRIAGELSRAADVWSLFGPAAMPKDSISLGQGFMSWQPPAYIRKALEEAVETRVDVHHYSHAKGRPRLRAAIAQHYSREFPNLVEEGRELDPETEVVVTAGANEGIYAALAAFLEPGEQQEVILFEPAFDQYSSSITFNGGKEVFVPIRFHGDPDKISTGNDWKIDIEEFKTAITPKTRAIILNTPHNPIGKVFTKEELLEIGKVAEEHDLLIIADEVYDCLTFDGVDHVRIAGLPGFWERTLTVGSAGKSFAATGWRVGWVLGHAPLIRAVLAASTRVVFCVNSPTQEAAAIGLELAAQEKFFETQRKEYERRRAALLKHIDALGLPYTLPQGSYFVLIDISRLKIPGPDEYDYPESIKSRPRDFHAAWWLAHEIGIVAIPPSEFYSEPHAKLGERFLRLAFCKEVDVLEAAGERLQKLKPYIAPA